MNPLNINGKEWFPTGNFKKRFDEVVGNQENVEKFLKRMFREGIKEPDFSDPKIVRYFHYKLDMLVVATTKNVLITMRRISEKDKEDDKT